MSVSFYGYSEPAPGESPEFIDGPNFANDNAAMIARSLGIADKWEYGGSWDLDDFEGRVKTAQAVGGGIADDGQDDIVTGGPGTGRATMVDCGVRPGYFADAYDALADLCADLRAAGIDRVLAA